MSDPIISVGSCLKLKLKVHACICRVIMTESCKLHQCERERGTDAASNWNIPTLVDKRAADRHAGSI